MSIILKSVRKNLRLTQEQVSSLTGIPVKTLRNWEQGIRKPSEWTVDLIIDKMLSAEMQKSIELSVDGDASPLSDIDLYMESDIFGLEFYGVIEKLRMHLIKK